MKELVYVNEEGRNIKFIRYSDIVAAIIQSGAFISTKPRELKTLNDILNYKKKLNERIAAINEYDQPDQIHLFCTDVYYLYKLNKYQRQLKYCNTAIGLYSSLYNLEFEDLESLTNPHDKEVVELAQKIAQQPIIIKFFDANFLIANKYATYLFNKNNPGLNFSECDYFDFQGKAFEELKNKNRRS